MTTESTPQKSVIPAENYPEIISDVVEHVLYSHIPGHEKGKTLKIGQLDQNARVEDVEENIVQEQHRSMKERLSALQADRVREEWIPDIIQQLTSIVIELGESADHIINSSEELEGLVGMIDGNLKIEAEKHVTQLIEASSFHDLSNQRLQQVIRTLSFIEMAFDGMLGVLGDPSAEKRYSEKFSLLQQQQLKDKNFKQGPQKRDSTTQDEIDQVFNNS